MKVEKTLIFSLITSCLAHLVLFLTATKSFDATSAKVSVSALIVNVSQLQKRSLDITKGKTPSKSSSVPQQSAGVKKVSAAKLVSTLAPEYPWTARMRGQQGVVVVELEVDENGKPFNVTIIKSSGFDSLDSEAIKAVIKAQYTPAKGNASTKLKLDLNFKLRDET